MRPCSEEITITIESTLLEQAIESAQTRGEALSKFVAEALKVYLAFPSDRQELHTPVIDARLCEQARRAGVDVFELLIGAMLDRQDDTFEP